MSETLIVTLTLTTVVTFLAILVGGMIGWLAKQHSYETHPKRCMHIQRCLIKMGTYQPMKF